MTVASAWTDLGGGVLVRQSRAYRMNSVVLLHGKHTVVVDPGVLPSELDDLARTVREVAPAAVTLLFTHAHWDHVLGRPWWPAARTIAHDRFAGEVRRDRERTAREAAALAERHGERWKRGFEPFRPDEAVSGLRFVRLDPWRLVFRDAPGHCASQLSLHLPDRGILVAADMLSDLEIPSLDGPPAPYRETLAALMLLAERGAIETVIPGHGSVARGREPVLARFRHDLEYLRALESGVRASPAGGLTLAAARERLAAMEYTGKHSREHPTEAMHLENVEHAFRAAAQPRR